MKRLLTLLALVLCSCAETFVGEEIARPNSENLPDLTASFADEDATRTYVENNKYLRWHEDDRLTAFFGNTLNRQYKFNGATGDNSGTFSLVPDGMLGTGNAFDRIYALYPYNADARITDEGIISLTLPAEQDYAENSFGRGANTMLAVTENVEDTFLSFKNACGYLKLRLYNAEGATIKSIEVKGNSGERLAGTATVTINYGEAPTLTMAESATDAITLDCGEGVALGTTAETATEFWVVLPATTFAEGLTITATDTEGSIFEKSTTNEVVIERNAIQPMAALEVVYTKLQPNNEIWYTATEKVEPYDKTVFGAKYQSNEWNSDTGEGVITFDGNVASIGDNAFYDCRSLTSITIPDSVTSIGEKAFYCCWWIESITIPDSVISLGFSAFAYCQKLTNVTIGNGLTMIGRSAFYGCSHLTTANIPDSVTEIGYNAFAACSSLQEFSGKFASEDGRCLIIDGELNSFASAGLAEYAIPDNVTKIGESAFHDCQSLTSVIIGNSVTTIGWGAFNNCDNLTSATIGENVIEIGENAFVHCDTLTSVIIGDSITTIGVDAFWACTTLTSVYCKATTPPSLGSRVFQYYDDNVGGYRNLNCRIYVPTEAVDAYKSASSWSEYADAIVGYNFETGEVFDPTKPAKNEIWYTNGSTTEATTPYKTNVFGANIVSNTYSTEKECWVIKFDGEVTSIGKNTFYNCYKLTSITIPDGVTTIGHSAFYECRNLTSVTIPDSVTCIEWYAFSDCYYLTSITIPDSVTTIGAHAFYKCSRLTSIYCKAITPPITFLASTNGYEFFWDAFNNNASSRKIYVPAESVEAYKTAEDWSNYASYIVGYDFENGGNENPQNSSYTVTLNNAWRQSTSVSNPDSSLYDGVYESYSNYNKDNGAAMMYIDIEGYNEFCFYIRSDAESTYDYVTVSELDSTSQKMSTSGKQNSGTAISNYTKVTYTGIDGGSHRIIVTYRKDGSVNEGTDRGYLIIPKNQ